MPNMVWLACLDADDEDGAFLIKRMMPDSATILMVSIHHVFGRLGLESYTQTFCAEGFETWESLLDITEKDLEALGVKRGHRRKLQREIATFRGLPKDLPLSMTTPHEDDEATLNSRQSTNKPDKDPSAADVRSKRKYRRHPKPDINAPVKPVSAYVSFANQVREELKSQNLSFTEMAKLVGDRWKGLPSEVRDAKEAEAAIQKELYLNSLKAYTSTNQHRLYEEYLAEFTSKYGSDGTDSPRKRSKSLDSNCSSFPSHQDTLHISLDDTLRPIRVPSRRASSSSQFGLGLEPQIVLPPIRSLKRCSLGNERRVLSPPLLSFIVDSGIGTETSSDNTTPSIDDKSQHSFPLPAIHRLVNRIPL